MSALPIALPERRGPGPPGHLLDPAVEFDLSTALEVHALARATADARRQVTLALARCAERAHLLQPWRANGRWAGLADFTREVLQRDVRSYRDLVRLGRAMRRFPELESAVSGTDAHPPLGAVAALLVDRIADRATVAGWIAFARHVDVRQLADAVRAARAGDPAPGATITEPVEVRAEQAELPDPLLPPDEDAVRPPEQEIVRLRLPVPPAVRSAFDTALDLYRRACGAQASVVTFIEALRGDFLAGRMPFPLGAQTPPVGPSQAERERRAIANGPAFDAMAVPAPPACRELEELRAELQRAKHLIDGSANWRAEDADRLVELSTLEARCDVLLGRALLVMARHRPYRLFAVADLEHYAAQHLGISRSVTRRLTRIARAARQAPVIAEAWVSGAVGVESLDRIIRLFGLGHRQPDEWIDQGMVAMWVDHAREVTVRRLDDEIGRIMARRLGQSGGASRPLTDAEWRDAIRRSPGDAESHLRTCTEAAAEYPEPLAILTLDLPADTASNFLALTDAAGKWIRGQQSPDEQGRTFASPADLLSGAPAQRPPLAGISGMLDLPYRFDWLGLLVLLRAFVAEYDRPRMYLPTRRTQRVADRDGMRCLVPGCTRRAMIELHHVEYRSRGGADTEENLVCLCWFHHQQAVHLGRIRIEGKAPDGLVFTIKCGPSEDGEEEVWAYDRRLRTRASA